MINTRKQGRNRGRSVGEEIQLFLRVTQPCGRGTLNTSVSLKHPKPRLGKRQKHIHSCCPCPLTELNSWHNTHTHTQTRRTICPINNLLNETTSQISQNNHQNNACPSSGLHSHHVTDHSNQNSQQRFTFMSKRHTLKFDVFGQNCELCLEYSPPPHVSQKQLQNYKLKIKHISELISLSLTKLILIVA